MAVGFYASWCILIAAGYTLTLIINLLRWFFVFERFKDEPSLSLNDLPSMGDISKFIFTFFLPGQRLAPSFEVHQL